MGVDAMRPSVRIRRFLGISIIKCYKLVYRHPLLVGMVCFLILLYRSFPLLFSVLVSASPVLVCTALLLGTLLSFGEPNIPEIEKEKEEEGGGGGGGGGVTQEVSSLKREVAEDSTIIFERDEDFSVESFVGKRNGTKEEGTGGESWGENRVSKNEQNRNLGDFMPFIDGRSREIQLEKNVTEVERESDGPDLVKKTEIHEEKQGIEEVLSNGKAQVEDPKTTVESIRTHEGGHLDSEDLSWRRVNGDDEEEEDEDEEASDSGSDGAESSSPDASITDIMPMLDELHPLLNVEAPQQADNGSDAGSEESHKADGEDGDDDDDDNEEGEVQGGKEDDSKSAIKWTEDDQKNLMDLGTSELERNQRLESLIARRRARHSMKLMAERNLIDFDGADLPVNIAPITTTRRNPFDFPFDPYDDVPGSAPSVLLPGHNPFDLPYDSNEEKPDLKGDGFQQEFSPFHHREAAFRRHESFSVGPSAFGGTRQGGLRWKPYFVPERLFGTEDTSHHSFQRQLSEASESKLSSVPDTESISSAVEDKLNQEDLSQEADMISSIDHASVLVERGSLSSEDVDALDIGHEGGNDDGDGAEVALGDGEIRHEDSSLSPSGGATPVEVNTSEILLRMEPGEDEYSSRSSISSLSEIDERISDVKQVLAHPETSNGEIEESQISTQTSLDSDFHFMSEVVDENQHGKPVLELSDNHAADFVFTTGAACDNQHKEPVYDSSPQPAEKLIPLLSLSSDIQRETPETSLAPISSRYAGKESGINSEIMEEAPTPYRETHDHFTEDCSLDENESKSRETTGVLHDVRVGHLLEDYRASDGQIGKEVFMTPKAGFEHDAVDLPLSLLNERSITAEPHDNMIDKLDSASCSNLVVSEETILHAPEEQLPVHVPVASIFYSSSESETVKENVEGEQVPSSDAAEKCPEPSSAVAESKEEVSITNNEMSEPNSVLPESLEYKSQIDEVDFKESILDKIVYEDSGHTIECPTYSAETDGPPVTDEDEDVIKEIDEGLLAELDTVGDFRVKEVVGESLNDEQIPNSDCDSLPRDSTVEGATFPSEIRVQPLNESRDTRETNLDLQSIDARPSEDGNLAMEKQQASEVNIEEMPRLSNLEGQAEENEVGSSSSIEKLPVLEIRSANDMDLVFKQLSEGAEVEEVIVPSTIEHANESAETSSDMQVVEARSVEELQTVMKQVSEGDVKEAPKTWGPIKEIFTKFTVVATEEGILQKTESNAEESTEEETKTKDTEEPKGGLLKYLGF